VILRIRVSYIYAFIYLAIIIKFHKHSHYIVHRVAGFANTLNNYPANEDNNTNNSYYYMYATLLSY
jgi:hypothetical protein